MNLKLVLGMTCKSGNCLTGHAQSGLLAYVASNAVVLFDTLLTKQVGYLQESRQPIACISFSLDGTHLLSGHVGYKPDVQVWNVAKRTKLASLHGHDCGIRCVAFSPKLDMIVSVGNKFDGFVYVWAWPQQQKIACNRFAEEIKAMAYDPLNRFFVTCGVHHIKFWYPESVCEPTNENRPYSLVLMKDLSTLYRRPALLEHVKTATFISVACGSGRSADMIYAVSVCGFVCRLSSTRTIEHVQRLDDYQLSSISVHDDLIFVSSVIGKVFLFDSLTMKAKRTLSFPIDMCLVTQAKRAGHHWKDVEARDRHGIYLFYDGVHKLLSAISLRGSQCLWDLRSLVAHKVEYYTSSHFRGISDSKLFKYRQTTGEEKNCLLTVSHDATILLWGLKINESISCDKVWGIYTEFLDQQMEDTSDCDDSVWKNLISAVTTCGDLIVTGNAYGAIKVYSIKNMELVMSGLQGHKRGVTCLCFCVSSELNYKYLFSGSRDRQINVYDGNNQFCLLNTLSFHSGSLTDIGAEMSSGHILLVSTALDRSLVLSHNGGGKDASYTVKFNRIMPSSLVGFCFYEFEQQLFIVVGTRTGDIHVIDTSTCSIVRSFRASKDPRCKLEKLSITPGDILFTSYSDRSVNALNFRDGTILSSVIGQASSTTGIHFVKSQNCFVSTSKDGCIFIWDVQRLINEIKTVDKRYNLEKNVTSFPTATLDKNESRKSEIQFLHRSKTSGPPLIEVNSIIFREKKFSTVTFHDSFECILNTCTNLRSLGMKKSKSCESLKNTTEEVASLLCRKAINVCKDDSHIVEPIHAGSGWIYHANTDVTNLTSGVGQQNTQRSKSLTLTYT